MGSSFPSKMLCNLESFVFHPNVKYRLHFKSKGITLDMNTNNLKIDSGLEVNSYDMVRSESKCIILITEKEANSEHFGRLRTFGHSTEQLDC